MEISYWESRWRKNKIGFHMEEGYPLLRHHFHRLKLPDHPSVLVPLCGKSVDMLWLRDQGCRVIGIEAIPKAIEEFTRESGLSFKKTQKGFFDIHKTRGLELWVGDFLKLPETLPDFDLIYDKAALVALPETKRKPYAEKVLSLCTKKTHLFLHHFEYNQDEMNGPPFSVPLHEIEKYYSAHFSIICLHEEASQQKYEKFQHRGLESGLTERFLLLKPLQK